MNRFCSWSYLSVGTSSVFSPFPVTIQQKKIKGEEKELYVSGKESIAAPSGSSPATFFFQLSKCLITNLFLK